MIHNLTDRQLQVLRWIVEQVNNGVLEESFIVVFNPSVTDMDSIRIDKIESLPDYMGASVLDALMKSDVLVWGQAAGGMSRFTLTRKAYEIAAFDFTNPDPDPLSLYMKETYPLIKERFDREELRGLCLDLDIQPDWVFGDKTDWPLYLLLHVYRQNQLEKLSEVLEKKRDGWDWPKFPKRV